MEHNKYNIIFDNPHGSQALEDYKTSIANRNQNKGAKLGVIGSVLLCTSPAIYAKECDYVIKDDVSQQAVEFVLENCNSFELFVNDVNKLDELNFSKKEIIKDILSFKTLKNNWDGYDAIPLEIQSAANSVYLLDRIDEKLIGRINDFYPNTHGTISFEWINELDEKLVLEIGNETFSYFVKFNSSEPKFFNYLELNNENIKKLSTYISSI